MVSQSTRNTVWQSYLDVARNSRYYEALANRYQWYYRSVRFALLFMVIVSVAVPYTSLSHPASWILGTLSVGITAILVAVDYVGDFAKKSAVLHGISVEVNRLESDWELLWLEIDDSDAVDSEMRQRNKDYQRLLMTVEKRAGEEGITIDHKLNQKCTETAYAIMEDRYRYAYGEEATAFVSR